MYKKVPFFALLFALIFASVASATDVALRPDHPDRYVVVKGDTLWDISARFLRDPWLWPDIWYANPQIANPHLIYPGDVISLVYVGGKPQLRLERGKQTVKLSPEARAIPLEKAIPTIPLDAIRPFLTEPRVVGKDELDAAPYIVQSAGEHLVTGAGDRVYVRRIEAAQPAKYTVVRSGDIYKDPDSGEILGYEALFIGDAALQHVGDPATLKLTRTSREARVGDRLIPSGEETYDASFQPHAPKQDVKGRIIAVVDGVSQIGQNQVVVINRGSADGMEVGHVLAVYQKGDTVKDVVTANPKDTVKLPDERAGLMMVFRTFNRVSYGLIMTAQTNMHVLDYVTNP
jgi:nucleoid-associated protein YgaU